MCSSVFYVANKNTDISTFSICKVSLLSPLNGDIHQRQRHVLCVKQRSFTYRESSPFVIFCNYFLCFRPVCFILYLNVIIVSQLRAKQLSRRNLMKSIKLHQLLSFILSLSIAGVSLLPAYAYATDTTPTDTEAVSSTDQSEEQIADCLSYSSPIP